jgi:hypothetical protein
MNDNLIGLQVAFEDSREQADSSAKIRESNSCRARFCAPIPRRWSYVILLNERKP